MAGALLDTHALYWMVSGEQTLSERALVAVGEQQRTGSLYISPITSWELSLAAQKPRNAPQFGGLTLRQWLRAAMQQTSARFLPINERIALEASEIVAATGHKDPGDCYLIATARVRRIPIVTRDATILKIAEQGYLDVIAC